VFKISDPFFLESLLPLFESPTRLEFPLRPLSHGPRKNLLQVRLVLPLPSVGWDWIFRFGFFPWMLDGLISFFIPAPADEDVLAVGPTLLHPIGPTRATFWTIPSSKELRVLNSFTCSHVHSSLSDEPRRNSYRLPVLPPSLMRRPECGRTVCHLQLSLLPDFPLPTR